MPITDLALPVLRPLGGPPSPNRAPGQSPGAPGLSRLRSSLGRGTLTAGAEGALPARRLGATLGVTRVIGALGVQVF